MTRVQAEQLLAGKNVGAFAVRNSSTKGQIALSFVHEDGHVMHGLFVHNDGQWSVENREPFQPTLELLLQNHPGLNYDETEIQNLVDAYNERFPPNVHLPPPPTGGFGGLPPPMASAMNLPPPPE